MTGHDPQPLQKANRSKGAKPEKKRVPGGAKGWPRMEKVTQEDGTKKDAYEKAGKHGLSKLMGAVGTENEDFAIGIFSQVAHCEGTASEKVMHTANFRGAMMEEIAPRDAIETALAAQMVATHCAAMEMARRLRDADHLQLRDSCERTLTKLNRTFIAQVETLKKYRTGGQQKVTVEHVHVHEGGQAIVGTVSSGGGGRKRRRSQTS